MQKVITTLTIIVLLCGLTCFSAHRSLIADNSTLFFYNPEVNINNFTSLKIELDTYLTDFGNYKFQPFAKKDAFENFVALKKVGLLLVSSWHYKLLKTNFNLVPLLVGVSKGLSTYRKTLVVKDVFKDIESLKGVTLASSGTKDYTLSVLNEMFGKKHSDILKSLKILIVPKDIDALMSVGFGMSQAALVTEKSVKKLEAMSPNLSKTLKSVAISDKQLLPIVAAFKESLEMEKELVDIIASMDKSPKGLRDLKMIGLDSWKLFTEKEMEFLKN